MSPNILTENISDIKDDVILCRIFIISVIHNGSPIIINSALVTFATV